MDERQDKRSEEGSKDVLEIPVTIVNPIWCATDPKLAPYIKSGLSYETEVWLPNRFGSRSKEKSIKSMMKKTGRALYFHTGLLPRLVEFCSQNEMEVRVTNAKPRIPFKDPFLPITVFSDGRVFKNFRADQLALVDQAVKNQRGIIKAFTGFGKSIVIMGIMSAFPDKKILFLCDKKGLLLQLASDLKEFKFKFGILGAGVKTWQGERIVLATRQSLEKEIEHFKNVEVILLDEGHHCNSRKSQYFTLLEQIPAPIRLAFTATLPDTDEKMMALEAMFGPVVAEVSIADGEELGILASPKICVREVPQTVRIRSVKNYIEAYNRGVVENFLRNQEIVKDIKFLTENNLNTLVMVSRVEHGKIIRDMFREVSDTYVPFVHGNLSDDTREEFKKVFKTGEIKCCIANVVWREAIDIPAIDCILNASGGKSEIMTLQTVGRGTRKTKDKNEVLIVEYQDNIHRWFEAHFEERMKIYRDNNWEFLTMTEFIQRRR